MLNIKSSEPKRKNKQETQTKEGHWKKTASFFLFCFSSSKNNAQLVPQYLKKLKTLKNISFVYIYIYLYLYLYLYNLLFFIFQTAAVSVCEWVVEAQGDPHRAAVWDTNTGRAVLTGYGSSWQLITHHAYDPGFSKRTHKDGMQPCPPHSHTTSTTETNRKKEHDCGMFHPLTYSYLSSTLLPPTPRHPPGRAGIGCVSVLLALLRV